MRKNTMGNHAWKFHEEVIDRLPPNYEDVGIGKHLEAQSGFTKAEILGGVMLHLQDIEDGGAMVGIVGSVRVYFHRRGKSVDVGSREDFEELGWQSMCDALDEAYPPNSQN